DRRGFQGIEHHGPVGEGKRLLPLRSTAEMSMRPSRLAASGACVLLLVVDGCATRRNRAHVQDAKPNARVDAARDAAENGAACKAIDSFYWEIGDAKGPIASGSTDRRFDATRAIPLASATKWLWGAYVVERSKSTPAAIDASLMTMRGGYTG